MVADFSCHHIWMWRMGNVGSACIHSLESSHLGWGWAGPGQSQGESFSQLGGTGWVCQLFILSNISFTKSANFPLHVYTLLKLFFLSCKTLPWDPTLIVGAVKLFSESFYINPLLFPFQTLWGGRQESATWKVSFISRQMWGETAEGQCVPPTGPIKTPLA